MARYSESDRLAALERLAADRETVCVQTGRLELWLLAAQVQLALRHPHNDGPTGAMIRPVLELIAAAWAHEPALVELFGEGFKAEFDVPSDAPGRARRGRH